jgi:hypothetical protein
VIFFWFLRVDATEPSEYKYEHSSYLVEIIGELMTGMTGRDAAIQGLRGYRKELVDNIEKLKEDLRVVDRSIALLGGSTASRELIETLSRAMSQDAGPQEAVENFLRASPGRYYRPREVGKLIREAGYQPKTAKPEIWFAQVTNCLRRAVNKGIAEMKQIDGKKTYGLKQPEGSGETP